MPSSASKNKRGKWLLQRIRERRLVAALPHRSHATNLPHVGLGILQQSEQKIRRCPGRGDRGRGPSGGADPGLPLRTSASHAEGKIAKRKSRYLLAHSLAQSRIIQHLPLAAGTA